MANTADFNAENVFALLLQKPRMPQIQI